MRISAEKEAVLSSTTVIVITNSSLSPVSRFLLGAKNLLTGCVGKSYFLTFSTTVISDISTVYNDSRCRR